MNDREIRNFLMSGTSLKWATRIGERYMGINNADAYGKRNSDKGELLVRIKPTRIVAERISQNGN
jgi:hypothetical protein